MIACSIIQYIRTHIMHNTFSKDFLDRCPRCSMLVIMDWISPPPGGWFLDWGSACGHKLVWAKQLYGLRVVGIDTQRESVQWARQHARTYDWATQQRSSEATSWHQSLLDEAATADGAAPATTFMDLAKAFETVSLEHVWRAGLRHGFLIEVLKLLLEAFAFARRLS